MIRAFLSTAKRTVLVKNEFNHKLLKFVNVSTTTIRCLKYEPIVTKNKIEIGHKMTQVIDKKRQNFLVKKAENEKYNQTTNNPKSNRRLLIAAFNPNFNHFTNQAYRNFSERNFASYGWKNRRSTGQYFTINAIGSHPSLIDSNIKRTSDDQIIEFSTLELNKCLVNRLKLSFGITKPTHIQYMSLKEIMQRNFHNLIIAETGGGKTLCYALPMIEYSIRVKHQLKKMNIQRERNQPIGLVLVPTRELAFQVYETFKKLVANDNQVPSEENKTYLECLNDLNVAIDLHASQIKAKEDISNTKIDSLGSTSEIPVDILITTPGQLEDRLFSKYLNSAYLRNMVVDETDTLFDDSFSEVTLKCLNKLQLNLTLPQIKIETNSNSEGEENFDGKIDIDETKSKKTIEFYLEMEEKLKDPSTQLVFASATIPLQLQTTLEGLIDWQTQLKTIKTTRINRLMLHVPQKFIRTNGTKKPSQLLEIVQKDLKNKNSAMMVFCYKSKTATYISKYLIENDIEGVELLTKKLNNRDRERVVNRFFKGEARVLVCTDIASRGWNTLQVDRVVNFEMPLFIADYLHRVGRVGRLGSKNIASGRVTNFVSNKFDADLVWNIERSIRLGVELQDVNANIKRLYNNITNSLNK